jgi:hypothetical protein
VKGLVVALAMISVFASVTASSFGAAFAEGKAAVVSGRALMVAGFWTVVSGASI